MKRIALFVIAAALALGTAGPSMAAAAAKKPAKKAVVFADYSKQDALGNSWGDDSKGCKATLEKKGGKAVLAVPPCADGWGAGMTLFKNGDRAIDASGKPKLVIKAKVTKGGKFTPSLNEVGTGPKEATSYQGSNGSDGEQWWGTEQVGTGKVKDYTFKLADFTVSGGYGNQNGNKKMDLQAVDAVQVAVGGNQPAVTVEVSSIKFE